MPERRPPKDQKQARKVMSNYYRGHGSAAGNRGSGTRGRTPSHKTQALARGYEGVHKKKLRKERKASLKSYRSTGSEGHMARLLKGVKEKRAKESSARKETAKVRKARGTKVFSGSGSPGAAARPPKERPHPITKKVAGTLYRIGLNPATVRKHRQVKRRKIK